MLKFSDETVNRVKGPENPVAICRFVTANVLSWVAVGACIIVLTKYHRIDCRLEENNIK